MSLNDLLKPPDVFARRHIGASEADIQHMLDVVGVRDLDELVQKTVPASIQLNRTMNLPAAATERAALDELRQIAQKNKVYRSYLGMGYHNTVTPGVIKRNILENPGWYTAYTPYQAEIAQGRLEMLLNFQTVITDLTGLPAANASLLDEGTAAAEAMSLSHRARARGNSSDTYFVSELCHPQTIAVVKNRAEFAGIQIIVGDHSTFDFAATPVFGALVQYPATDGAILDYSGFCAAAKAQKALVTVAADLLSLTLLRPPGEFGADLCVGSSQRFGVPLGYGGPHAAFMAGGEDLRRQMPGRIIGVSKDARGERALRMALQTREQHIRRHKATSNICTAQVLLSVMAAAYAIYHGPEGLKAIARRVRAMTAILAAGLAEAGHEVVHADYFDTLRVRPAKGGAAAVLSAALRLGINLRDLGDGSLCVSFDETVGLNDVADVLTAFGADGGRVEALTQGDEPRLPAVHARKSSFLRHPVFSANHSETQMLRYLHSLEAKDLALNAAMIPLGSCTMKLNATAEMEPVTWAEFGALHPFAPVDQAEGYAQMFEQLEAWLAEITGFDAVSLQPNAGSQGEYAGLLVIQRYHQRRGEGHRNVCLIPTSAHGTNPASAVMAGLDVVAVACDSSGNVDLADLRAKADQHAAHLSALMVTYPSTHGVFEEGIKEICAIVHERGGQVYMDGANMNAQVGLCRPGDIGADVCHLNLHKTFCIPHGGGGPGMGPICMKAHLAPFRPGHPVIQVGGDLGPISAAPWGSPSILPISWMYIRMMGPDGLKKATEVAILVANYVAARLSGHYEVLYRGTHGLVAHECILDTRPLKTSAGVEVDDIAKRLMDYGFHAPTMSWPVVGTLMVEPTESEPLVELDRFVDAMIRIRDEARAVERGEASRENNPLKGAPHTADMVTSAVWDRPYSREQAAFPAPWLREFKLWPAVARVDNAYGDRNLVCTCPTVEELAASK